MYRPDKVLTTIKTKNGFVIKCKSCNWNSRMDESHICFASKVTKGCVYYQKVFSAINKEYVKPKAVEEEEEDDDMTMTPNMYRQERRAVLYKMNKYSSIIEPDPKLLVKYKIKINNDGEYY